ncbi:MAG: DNA polymerase III subunit delta [Acidimicrobiales bacterium]
MTIRLITGDDPVLVAEALATQVNELIGDGDRSLMLEQLTEADLRTADGGWDLARLLDAARTPPFLTSRRVVVGRHLARFGRKQDHAPIVELVGEDLPTTDLVLVWERGLDPKMDGRLPTLPRALKEAVEVAGGELVTTDPGRGRAGGEWLRDQLGTSSLEFDRAAVMAVQDLLGEDRSRVIGLVRTLEGALGPGASVSPDDVITFGGEAGAVVPWELDDAIDGGDVAAALEALRRLLPSRHPFQLLAALHGRYQRMLRLDGADVVDAGAAAALLGMKGSSFPARKLLAQSRRLGSDRLARAIRLLADADLALRGTVDWPDGLVLEVLVARLAALSPRSVRSSR